MNLFTYAKYHLTSLNNSFIMKISTIDGKKLREKNKYEMNYTVGTYTCGLNVVLYTSPEAHLLITEEGTYNIGNVLKQLYIHFNKNSSTAKMKYRWKKNDENETIQQQLQLNAVTNTHNSNEIHNCTQALVTTLIEFRNS